MLILKDARKWERKGCQERKEGWEGGRVGGREKGREKEDLYLSFLMFYHQSILMCNVLLGSFWSPNSVPLCPDCTDFLVPSLSKSPFHTTFVIIIGLLGFSVCLLACLDLFYFWIVCMLVCLCSFTCIQVPTKVTVVLDPLAGVTVRVLATQYGCWESNPCPAEDQGVLSITEQSFQHSTYLFLR